MSEPPPAPDAPLDPAPIPAATESPTTVTVAGIFRANWGEAAGRPLLGLVFVWLLGVVPALILWAWGGPGGLLRTPAVAWTYVSAFHAVPLVATGSSLALQVLSPTGTVGLTLFVCPMLGTLAALTLCFHAGRGLARTSMAKFEARASWIVLASASRIALIYALAFLGVSALAKLTYSFGDGPAAATIVLHPAVSHAFLAPFAIAFAGALAGAYTALRSRMPRTARAGAACVTGGAAAIAVAITLGIVGWGVLAIARPDTTANYGRWLAARGAVGASAVLANQMLALPNHGMFVLAPAMGVCDRVSTGSAQQDAVCLRHVAASPSQVLSVPGEIASGSIPQRSTPGWFLAFLLVPAAGCWVGGAMAVRELGRDRTSIGARSAALVGAGAGAAFAALSCVGAMLVTVRADAFLGSRPVTLSIGPSPWFTGLLGLGWGLVFSTAGALVWALRRRARMSGAEPPEPERPDPGRAPV